ncbi:TMV resistance protein N-like [Pyrus ussuriensis x Pyrus communis]|uniref:TMV resistance protein N-like n=1 Tax=Pyrus ussuriensis x Pyrus communis TaxID=2448454 RepID=A0A5N5HFQ5_9ROSA|nr:TMV resistance protein N-like [Pyrus ussuriensis x Pyrus communis]
MDSRIKEMLSCLQIGSNEVRIIGFGVWEAWVRQPLHKEATEKQGIAELQKKLISDILLESDVNIKDPEMGALIILDDVGLVKQLNALCGHIVCKEEWSSALDGLKENSERKIIDVLKKVFLDIACFFKGKDKHRITRILESSYGYHPVIDIKVLMEKCLLTPVGRKLSMHDMIQEMAQMGREIVRRESPEEVGNRSRLWLPNENTHVLENNMGTAAVQSILLNLPKEEEVNLNVKDPFLKIERLRLLKIWNGTFFGNINYLSNELALLELDSCPLNTLSSNYESDKLVELRMHSSCIKQIWKGAKRWSKLTLIDMSDSDYLTKMPDFTKVPNLEKLVLQGCIRLVEVHPSLGVLNKLVLLDMRNCKFVESLPPSLNLESLQILSLSACSKLRKFPEVEGNMNSLLKLYLDGTAIEELPPSIQHLGGLTLLNLGDCKNLMFLPNTMECLTSLKSLILTGCFELDDVPENLNSVQCLEELDLSGTAIRESSFIVGMKNLKYISFQGCKDLPSKPWQSLFNCWWWGRNACPPLSLLFPTSLSALTCLTNLNLSDCNLMEGGPPDDIGSLVSLKLFQSLPKKFQYSLLQVNGKDCTSLMDLPNQFHVISSECSGTTTINSPISSMNTDNVTRTYTISSYPMTGSSIQSQHQCELYGWIYQSAFHLIVGAGCKILEWFDNAVISRDSIEIPIPPDLKGDKTWMRVAAVFTMKEHDCAVSYIESDLEAFNYLYKCDLRTNEFRLQPYFFRGKQCNFVGSESHLLCVFYQPSSHFPPCLNESSTLVASCETNHLFMVVQEFGIHLLYEQDVKQYIDALLSCYDVHKYQIIPSDDYIKLHKVDKATFKSEWITIVDNILRCQLFPGCTSVPFWLFPYVSW